jgi:hypothetical protein
LAYEILFWKMIHTRSENIYLCYEAELPFIPMPKMFFIDANDWEATAIQVGYNINTGKFEIATEPDTTIDDAMHYGHEIPSTEEVIEPYLETGWKKDLTR